MMPFVAKLTIAIIVSVTIVLIGYDIWVATNNISNSIDTISGRMRIWATQTPLIPWIWCGLAGHFFGPNSFESIIPTKSGVILLVFSTWTVLILGLVFKSRGFPIPPWVVCIPAFFAGAIFWAQ